MDLLQSMRFRGQLRRPLHDEIGRSFRNHDCRRVRVATWDSWHHGGINDPQTIDASYAKHGVNDRHLVDAHLAGSNLMPRRVGDTTYVGAQSFIGAYVRSRIDLSGPDRPKRRRVANSPESAKAGDRKPEIVAFAKIVGIDRWVVERTRGGEANRAATLRTVDVATNREAMAVGSTPIGNFSSEVRDKEELNVRVCLGRVALDEAAGLEEVPGEGSGPPFRELESSLGCKLGRHTEQRQGLVDLIAHVNIQVVLEVFAHAGELMPDLYAHCGQLGGVA